MPKITYTNKNALNPVPPGGNEINYVRDLDLNEIKTVVNTIDDNNPSQNPQQYEFVKTGNTGINQEGNIRFIITDDSKLTVQRWETGVWTDITTIGASIETDVLYLTEPRAQIRVINLDGSQDNLIRPTTTVEGVDVGNYNGTTFISTVDDVVAVIRGAEAELPIQLLTDIEESGTSFQFNFTTTTLGSVTHFELDAVSAGVNAQFKIYKDSVSDANLIYENIDDVFFEQGQGLEVPTGQVFTALPFPFNHAESISLVIQLNFVSSVTLRGSNIDDGVNLGFVPYAQVRQRNLDAKTLATQEWANAQYFNNASFDNPSKTITLTRGDTTTVDIDLTDLVNDATQHVDTVTYTDNTNTLTFTFVGGKSNIDVDLSQLPNTAAEIKAKLESLTGVNRLASSAINTPALGGSDGLTITSANANTYRNGFLNFPTSLTENAAATIDVNAFTVPDWIDIKNSSSHVVTITQTGGTIDGNANLVLNENEGVRIQLVEANSWKIKTDKDRFSDHSVVELSDVSSSGSGEIITDIERNIIQNFDTSVNNVLVAGSGINITHDTGNDTITISATGSSYDEPRITNFSINIPSRVDVDTDLNVQKTVNYTVLHQENIASIQLEVVSGDDKTLTNPTADGAQTENVTLSGIDTSSQGTVTFKISGIDSQGGSFSSSTIIVSVRNLADHEYIYYGSSDSNDPVGFDATTLTEQFEIVTGQNQYENNAIATYTGNKYFAIAYPQTMTLSAVFIDGFNQTGGFGSTNAITVNSVDYYVIFSNNEINISGSDLRITFS